MNAAEAYERFLETAHGFCEPYPFSCGWECCGQQGAEWPETPPAAMRLAWSVYLRACKREGVEPRLVTEATEAAERWC